MALRKITIFYTMGRFSDLRSMLTAVAFPEYSSDSLLGILSALHEQHPLQTIEYSNDWLVTDSHRLPYYYAQLHTPIYKQIILKRRTFTTE